MISFFDDAGDGIYGPVEAGMTYPVGSLSGKGTIDGYAVNCVAPQQLVKFHLGYKLHRNDFLDVRALCEKFNIEMPDEQKAYWNPVLKRFRAALDEIYGDRIERVVLFGSRARGDAREDSDYDVAVFLKDPTDRGSELNRLADLGTNILDETGEFIHAMAYRADSYNNERIPLMHEIRAHGIDL